MDEMADVYMYLTDVLNCPGAGVRASADVYEEKRSYYMSRGYAGGSQGVAQDSERLRDGPDT